ncbi:MAG: two-component sensor histidine kinase [Natronomonas sp.]|jgi:two-component sensor histidine kinase
MISVVDGSLIVGLFVGGWLCWFSYSLLQVPSQLGRRALATAIIILGIGSVLTAAVGIIPRIPGPGTSDQMWSLLPLVTWNLMTAPWFVFALQYTGVRPAVSRWRVVALTLPVLIVPFRVILEASAIVLPPTITAFIATVVFAYVLSLVAAGCYLLLRQVGRDARFPLQKALSLSLVPVGSLLLWNLSSRDITAVASAVAFSAGTIIIGVSLVATRYRYDLFESIPAVGTLGEDALVEQTDDLMFVIDANERVVQSNRSAVQKLDTTRNKLHGSEIGEFIGCGVEQLSSNETITIETPVGTCQYDPQLSAVTDPHSNKLGSILSFRDVSDRELRQQRLAVLNRVLRHNLRNRLDVIKSHAEALPIDGDEHRSSIIAAADDIAALGRQTKEIDQFVSAQRSSDHVDLTQIVQTALEHVTTTDVTVTTDMPGTAVIITNRQAVVNAIESPLKNAVNYAASSVTVTIEPIDRGYRVIISDDGPGIPTGELKALDTGTEDPLKHTTGLGLWQLKWAVMTLDGHVSFETEGGTIVRINIPDRGTAEPQE